ncbi:MAG: helix-turn-helix domain-containing protein [Pseudomonadota bacterium]
MKKPEMPPVPANIARYVEVLGVDDTVKFLLEFGGSEFWFPTGPDGRSELVEVLGAEKALAIAENEPALKGRIPLAKPWIAAVLSAKGLPGGKIARKLHVSDVTVRKYLADSSSPKNPRQLSLF